MAAYDEIRCKEMKNELNQSIAQQE